MSFFAKYWQEKIIPFFTPFNVKKVRRDFPLLQKLMNGHSLVYLDNAATTQKPQAVIDRLVRFYTEENSNVHRGIYSLSEVATEAYEAAREKVRLFIKAATTKEIVFTSGATAGFNLLAATFGKQRVTQGDTILISALEHHSNILPWQILAKEKGAQLKIVPINADGSLNIKSLDRLLDSKVKIFAFTHVSNALGTIVPVKVITALAHERGIPVIVDGAQAVQHLPVNVRDLDVDFYVFSGHKMFGPTGTGVIYGKQAWWQKMPPYQTGGEMVSRVTFGEAEYSELPHRFEAGTPNIAGVIGLGAAIDYINQLGLVPLSHYELALRQYALRRLKKIPGITLVGPEHNAVGVISFVIKNVHPHDVGTFLNNKGIAVRAGHHCAMPLLQELNLTSTIRVSLASYNTKQDINRLTAALAEAVLYFHR